ncbi:MAG: T9SS type A sorting domain-containing protein [Ignavibacteriaceae bacterium]|nr:T9SS type A sorting domain-containing protein [Ignavibacteriaceae bacterium]
MVCTNGCEVNGKPHLLEGRDFINNGTTPKPGYTQFTYPHPLRQNGPTDISEISLLPQKFELFQNYPNPFNPSTVISYNLPVSSYVTLKVFDILGNEVTTLVNEQKPVGTYEVEFNTSSIKHFPSSGIYFYQIKCGSFIQTKKMSLLK